MGERETPPSNIPGYCKANPSYKQQVDEAAGEELQEKSSEIFVIFAISLNRVKNAPPTLHEFGISVFFFILKLPY